MAELKIPEILARKECLKLPPKEREHYIREILRQIFNSNPHGVTVPLLSKKLPFDSRTIEKHLSILTYTNEVYKVKIGQTNLYLPNSRLMHHVLEKSFKTDNREYDAFVLQNRLGEFVFIQEKKYNEFTKEIRGGILIPLSDFKKFVEYLIKTQNQIELLKEGDINVFE